MKTIEQAVLNVGFREYQVELSHVDDQVEIREFSNSNSVFPAFITLINALERCENESVHVITDSYALASEYNAVNHNVNSRLLGRLKDKIAERKLNVTIEYVE